MDLGRKDAFFLFALGKIYEAANRDLKPKSLEIAVSKNAFIRIIRESSISSLSPRMIYRYLKRMEQRRLVTYDTRSLRLTSRGLRQYRTAAGRFEGFFRFGMVLGKTDIKKLCSRAQTALLG